MKYNKIHVLRTKIRVLFVFKSLKDETPLVFSILEDASPTSVFLKRFQTLCLGTRGGEHPFRVTCTFMNNYLGLQCHIARSLQLVIKARRPRSRGIEQAALLSRSPPSPRLLRARVLPVPLCCEQWFPSSLLP